MSEKEYRPKVGYEGLTLTANFPHREAMDITEWPYTTEDGTEQAYLDAHDAVTDRPLPEKTASKKLDKNNAVGSSK